jgi:hydroxymethylbilane synthase
LSEVGGKGLFVKEIEEALLEKKADLAVHSVKDVPYALPEGLEIVCIPKREDPRDALVAPRYGTLEALPKGARVGTSSLRRVLALKRERPDLTYVPVRGNVDTRLRKVDSGEFDAIVLAAAGLCRLGLSSRATSLLPPEVCLPASGQGALGIEARTEDGSLRQTLAAVSHEETWRCVLVERGVMYALGGDCKTPIAAFAERAGATLRLRAFVADPDGARYAEIAETAPFPSTHEEATALGREVGRKLLALR